MRSMKKMIRISIIAFAMFVAAGTAGVLGAVGAVPCAQTDTAYAADDDGYTYTITVYSGKEGYFDGDENKHTKTLIKSASYGSPCTIDMDELGLTVIDENKYYTRGVKRAGHDNDEVSHMTYRSYTFTVTKDESFTVAYGMKGGMVAYTVQYVDKSGNALLPAQTYYGMAGDKPVVSCKYVDGYIPDAINIGKTLVADKGQNVFTFTYSKNAGVGTTYVIQENANANAGNGNAANGNAANGNAPGTYTAGNNGQGPANFVNLDDNATPLANVDNEDTPTSNGGGISGFKMGIIGIVIAGILIALGLLYLILRRPNDEEE